MTNKSYGWNPPTIQPEQNMTPRERHMAIVERIAGRHFLTVATIMGNRRDRMASRARNEIYAELNAQGLGLMQIGRLLGRDHSSVFYGIKSHLGEHRPRRPSRGTV